MDFLNFLIAFLSLIVAIIAIVITIYFERKKGGISGLKITASFGREISLQKEDSLKRPLWLCGFGIPKFVDEEVIITLPLIVKNDSDVALKNVSIHLYYPNSYSVEHSSNEKIKFFVKEANISNERIKRTTSDFFQNQAKISFYTDYIGPHSFLVLHETIVVKRVDMETGVGFDPEVFKEIPKPIQFTIQTQIFSENNKPILFSTLIFLVISDKLDSLNKIMFKLMELILSQVTLNPFFNLKSGTNYFFPWPMLPIFKKKFSKYSFMISQITLGRSKEKNFPFLGEYLEKTVTGYGDMTFLVPGGRSSILSKQFRKKTKTNNFHGT